MKALLILSTLVLTACGQNLSTNKDPRTISGVDPAFVPYVELYKSMKGRGLSYDIPIAFGNQDGNVIGVCTRWSSGHRQIQIDPTYWNDPYTTEHEKISLIFHELGHCDLNRDHVTALRSNNWPVSLMYPYNYGYNSPDESYYFNELFNPTSASTSASTMASHDASCVHDIEVESTSNEESHE